MTEASVVRLVPASADEHFRARFEGSFSLGFDATLERVGLTREELEEAMSTTGLVRTIEVDGVDAGSLWTELRGRTLHIHALLLDEDYRGRGLGLRVLGLLEHEAAGHADELELGVEDANPRARRLYEKAGFHEVESRPDLGFRTLRKPLSPAT